MRFPFHPHADYLAHQVAVDAAIQRVLQSGHYILGPEVAAFEKEFAAAIGTAHCIGVGNGLEAIHIALRARGIGPGDTVITVSHTSVATVMAIELAGARPLLVDIDPVSYTLDPAKFEATLRANPGVKALILVHLYGQPAAPACVEIARQHGLFVLEDCAQAHGSATAGRTTGTWGDAAAFSFYPTKNLGAIGDGGAILTNDAALAARVRRLHQYGWQERYISHESGMNSRLDELQAAILRAKLPTLRADNARRAALAAIYTQALRGTVYTPPAPPADTTHVYHQYVIRAPRRDALAQALTARGIPWAIHYPQPVHLQPAYAGRVALGAGGMAATERASQEILSLPLHPHLDEAAIHHVVQALRELA